MFLCMYVLASIKSFVIILNINSDICQQKTAIQSLLFVCLLASTQMQKKHFDTYTQLKIVKIIY